MIRRPYQDECLSAIQEARDNGKNRQLVSLPTGCHAEGQGILLLDGSVKKVEDVKVGDALIGPDSTPRFVLQLIRGTGPLFKIIPLKGDPFVVDENHILSLVQTNEKGYPKYNCQKKGGQVVDVSVKEYLGWSKNQKHLHKLFRVGANFNSNHALSIDPYFLGVLLGNGCLKNAISVTDRNHEIVSILEKEAAKWGMYLTAEDAGEAKTYFFKEIGGRSGRNGSDLHQALVELGLRGTTSGDKFVPIIYKTGSTETRLNILAGLLDTDGHFTHNSYDYISKSELLSRDVAFLSRSLGLAAYVTASEKYCQTGGGGIYWRVSVSGETSIIPCRVEKKKAPPRKQKKNVLRTGFTIEPAETGDYFGFSLTGDGRYLMEDFTVTHNCGKTVVFSGLPSFLQENRKTLVLAHREELLEQARDKFESVNPGAFVDIEQADRYASDFANIIIASVPTLGRSASTRIQRFWPEQFGLIITDEAHHSIADTYQNIYRYFGLPERKDLLHVGFTATPKRGDGTGLAETFEEIVYHKDIQWMIDEGYLCRITGRRVSTGTDLSAVRSKMGDFQEWDLAQAVNNTGRNGIAVKSYIEFAKGKKCLAFAVDTDHTRSLRDAFLAHGIPAEMITGTTDRSERGKILSDFKSGAIRVLVNCMVLTEGFDEPSVECILMARPTKSALLHTQIIGRGTRLFPGKDECLIIDMVDNCGKHSVRTIPSLFGLPANLDLQGGDAREAEKKVRAFVSEHPHSRIALEPEQLSSLDMLNLESEKIDFFRTPTFSPEVLANSQLTWVAYDGGFAMSAGAGKEARIERDLLDQYEVILSDNNTKLVSQKERNMVSAFKAADAYVRSYWPDAIGLLNRSSKWREREASEAQKSLLTRMRVPFPSGITKGQAAILISERLARKR